MDEMIQTLYLTKTYPGKEHGGHHKNTVKVLDNLFIKINGGKVTALLGPNGAGKTTLLRILAGIETADTGAIYLNDHYAEDDHSSIAYLSDGSMLYPRLTGYENIRYFGELHGLSLGAIGQRINVLDQHLELQPLLAKRAGTCSLGERMRLLLARALIHDPQIIILDEPMNGLDLASVRKLRDYLGYLVSEAGGRKCVLFSTHHMHEVEKIASDVIILVKGQIKAAGTVEQIVASMGTQDFEEAFFRLAFQESSQ
ncbi:MAG: ABC transporter ATP-binding protein [Methylophilus methylotrophus]|uniref:ABC transporter ATP-binding protein n=1 Tax=Methylophilus methylotrophus TaxID=17 RepID=A0A5C7WL36_METME|nr:MAG: ABC transporter ATP-binding protein [Methylophilus methylotrophus]